jgi:hypothetical protein
MAFALEIFENKTENRSNLNIRRTMAARKSLFHLASANNPESFVISVGRRRLWEIILRKSLRVALKDSLPKLIWREPWKIMIWQRGEASSDWIIGHFHSAQSLEALPCWNSTRIKIIQRRTFTMNHEALFSILSSRALYYERTIYIHRSDFYCKY